MSARSKTTSGRLAGAALSLAMLAAPAGAQAAVRYTFVGSAQDEGDHCGRSAAKRSPSRASTSS